MFDIEHMKKARQQGVMLVPSEVDELILWAYARRNAPLYIDRAGIGQPSMLPPVDWFLAERISNEDHVNEALLAFKEDPTGDNATGVIVAALTVYRADTLALPPGNVGIAALPGYANAMHVAALTPSPAFVALVAPAAPAVGHENMQLRDGFPLIPDALGYACAAIRAQVVPAPTEPAHINGFADSNVYAALHARDFSVEIEPSAAAIDKLIPVYVCALTLSGTLEPTCNMLEGSYFARDDVLALFDVAD